MIDPEVPQQYIFWEALMDLGDNIARLRRARGLKQSELGERIGVSAQAVSKWEHGGAPDAALLPAIARALDTDVGTLFGQTGGDWRRQAKEELVAGGPEEAAGKICAFLWELQKTMGEALGFSDIIRNVEYVNTGPCQVRVIQDGGLWLSNIGRDLHYSLIVPEPVGGFAAVLAQPQEYERVFSVLGRKNRVRVLLWVYEQTKPVSLGKIESQLGAPVRDALEDLAELEFIQKLEVDTETGQSLAYGPLSKCSQLPFLFFLGEFIREGRISAINYHLRKKPLLD